MPPIDGISPEESWETSEKVDPPFHWDLSFPYGQPYRESIVFINDYLKEALREKSKILIKNDSFKKINSAQEEIQKDYVCLSDMDIESLCL